MNPLTWLLFKATGVPEPTIRLLVTILLAYPAATFYNSKYLNPKATSTVEERNRFILIAGFALNFFFNGISIYHSIVTTGVSYAICLVVGENMGDRKLAAAGVWIFNAVYLLLGYYFMQTDEYDITWTMTQCILCLRMMGFGFDYYDGRSKKAAAQAPTPAPVGTVKKAANPRPLSFADDTPLIELPSVESIFAFSMFPSAFLVGPQFSFSLYKKWLQDTGVTMTAEQREERNRAQTLYVWRSVVLAVIYLGLQQTIGASYSTSYLLTEEYQSFNFFKRAFIFVIAGKFTYNKYIGIWLLTEGATAKFGISYDGLNEEGHAKFGGLANTLPTKYESATTIDDVIGSFNINTNVWSKYYVFKRLQFLGSKQASQFGTLFFLAIWHGFHIMYFVTFALEFLFVQCQTVLRKRLGPVVQPYIKKNDAYAHIWTAVCWVACHLTITYSIIGFDLLKAGKSWVAYKSVYFIGHLAIVAILGANFYLPKPKSINKKQQ